MIVSSTSFVIVPIPLMNMARFGADTEYLSQKITTRVFDTTVIRTKLKFTYAKLLDQNHIFHMPLVILTFHL